ncbi:MAG: class I SAM-dependent methyltransferase [Candidatus Aenigmarchaeota archaeon]|nr:class I SAM-dependent methyltransferase [Candidatus Aenigmarchaeota archaeon]
MFFSSVYGGWEHVQREKYEGIFDVIGNELLARLFRKRTLDIGCGPCFLQKFLETMGIKSDLYSIDIEKTKPHGCAFVLADGNNLPFRNEGFFFITCIDTLHLLKTDDFRRVLRKRGFVLLSLFFNNDNFHERKNMLRQRVRGFDIITEFELQGQENEYVILAQKRYSH